MESTKRWRLTILLAGIMLLGHLLGGSSTATAETGERLWPGRSDVAVLVSSEEEHLISAVLAVPLAVQKNAPILFSEGMSLSLETKQRLIDLGVNRLYIPAGEQVISQTVRDEIRALGIELIDLGGRDRIETALNIAAEFTPINRVFIVNAGSISDAMMAVSVATLSGSPVLLTPSDQLPEAVRLYLAEVGEQLSCVIIGGPQVISTAVEQQLPGVQRIGGIDRYATNVQLLEYFQDDFDSTIMVMGNGEQSDLESILIVEQAAISGSPVLLFSRDPQEAQLENIEQILREFSPSQIYVPGGREALPEPVRTVIARVGITPEQIISEIPMPILVVHTEQPLSIQADLSSRLESSDEGEMPSGKSPNDEMPGVESPGGEMPGEGISDGETSSGTIPGDGSSGGEDPSDDEQGDKSQGESPDDEASDETSDSGESGGEEPADETPGDGTPDSEEGSSEEPVDEKPGDDETGSEAPIALTGKITTPSDEQTLTTMVEIIRGTVQAPDSNSIIYCKIAIYFNDNNVKYYVNDKGLWDPRGFWFFANDTITGTGEWEVTLSPSVYDSIIKNAQKQNRSVTIQLMVSDSGVSHDNFVECDRITFMIQ